MTTCSVSWCACLPAAGSEFCAAHRIKADLKPAELEPEEELLGSPETCEECDGCGDCPECTGDGTNECECICGHVHQVECEKCHESGRCQSCAGTGMVTVRHKSESLLNEANRRRHE